MCNIMDHGSISMPYLQKPDSWGYVSLQFLLYDILEEATNNIFEWIHVTEDFFPLSKCSV